MDISLKRVYDKPAMAKRAFIRESEDRFVVKTGGAFR
jgi:hypothetical protein